jgi:hypothetical protein
MTEQPQTSGEDGGDQPADLTERVRAQTANDLGSPDAFGGDGAAGDDQDDAAR